jgi:dynein heavy chain
LFSSLDAIFEQSKPTMPVVFITSPASDAIGDLVKLAERSGFGGSKFCSLCLGQGQELVSLVPLFIKTYFRQNLF